MTKKVLAVVMICCMMFSCVPIGVHAAQVEPIVPMWDNTSVFTANMTFQDTVGEFTVLVYGKSGVTNISVDVRLFYKNSLGLWTEIDTDWTYDVNQSYFSVTETFAGVAGREYKIEVSGVVTMNGVRESISKTATAICS